jgi:hypothetical protein
MLSIISSVPVIEPVSYVTKRKRRTYRKNKKIMLKEDKQGVYKLLITFQIYINHKILEILENGLHCSKEPLKFFVLIDFSADSGAAETYIVDERKMVVPPQQR